MSGVNTLPNEWTLTTLGKLSSLVQYGLNASSDEDSDGVLYLRISDIDNDGNAHLTSPKYVARNTHGLAKYVLEVGDIVIARSGSVGRGFVYRGSDEQWVFASYLIRFRPNQSIADSEYIGYFLRSPFYWRYINGMKRSVAQPNINSKELSALQIPLPSLPEQQRIVAILRQADSLRRTRREADEKARQLLPALFNEMFGNPSEWRETIPLGQLVDFVGGGTPSRIVSRYFTGDIPWATSKDMKSRYLNDAQEHITLEAIKDSATNLVPARTILVVVKSKILAHSLPVGITTRPFCFGQDLKGMICKADVSPQFIVAALLVQAESILQRARGVNTEGFTLEILRAIHIPKVDPAQQRRFTEQVTNYDHIEANQTTSVQKLDALFDGLLAQAFTGELTARWREAHHAELARAVEEMRARLEGKPRTTITIDSSAINLQTLAQNLSRFQSVMEDVATSITRFSSITKPTLDAFAGLADSVKPYTTALAEVLNSDMIRQMAALTTSTAETLTRTASALTQYSRQIGQTLEAVQPYYVDFANKIAQIAQLQLDRPLTRAEVEESIHFVADELPRYWTLADLTDDWRLNHLPRNTLREAVEMLVVRGTLRLARIQHATGDEQRPVAYIEAFTRVADQDLVAHDQIQL